MHAYIQDTDRINTFRSPFACFLILIHYSLLYTEELCGDVFVEHSGEFTSLNFPNRYPNNLKCVWRISTDPNRRIALGTKDNEFDVEPGSNIYSCNYDRVRVHDGPDKSYRSLGTFCGNIDFLRTFKTVYSTGPHLYVEFSSDHIVQKKGYHLQYSVFFEGKRFLNYILQV